MLVRSMLENSRVDPTLDRLGLGHFFFMDGSEIIAYIVAAIIIPEY